MILLALDTSLPRLAVSVSDGQKLLAGKLYPADGTHMAHVLPAIQENLAEAGKRLADVEVFAASTGPGSFTGIRIGVATIQQLATTMAKPCLALNSLEAAALAYQTEGRIVVSMLEARNRRIYAAAYWGQETLMEPQVVAVDEFMFALAKAAPSHCRELVFVGDETRLTYAADAAVRAVLPLVPVAADEEYYEASALAILAERAFVAQRFVPPAELLPEYYAPTQAERNFGVFL